MSLPMPSAWDRRESWRFVDLIGRVAADNCLDRDEREPLRARLDHRGPLPDGALMPTAVLDRESLRAVGLEEQGVAAGSEAIAVPERERLPTAEVPEGGARRAPSAAWFPASLDVP